MAVWWFICSIVQCNIICGMNLVLRPHPACKGCVLETGLRPIEIYGAITSIHDLQTHNEKQGRKYAMRFWLCGLRPN